MDQDADHDGYTNREEFLADTNPLDPKSMPGVMDTASVKTVNEVDVRISALACWWAVRRGRVCRVGSGR